MLNNSFGLKLDENGFLEPKKFTIVPSDDGTSCTHFAVYSRKDVDTFLGESAEAFKHPHLSLGEFLTGRREFYMGVGRAFAYAPVAKVGKYHVVVRQWHGRDI